MAKKYFGLQLSREQVAASNMTSRRGSRHNHLARVQSSIERRIHGGGLRRLSSRFSERYITTQLCLREQSGWKLPSLGSWHRLPIADVPMASPRSVETLNALNPSGGDFRTLMC